MHKFSAPPMFTSLGYQPSILMDSSPKSSLLSLTTSQVASAKLVRRQCVQSQAMTGRDRHGLVEVRVNAEAPPHYSPPEIPPRDPHSMPWMTSVSASPESTQEERRDSTESDDSGDDDMMEWTSCCSSPLFQPLPGLVRSDEPSPEMEANPNEPSTATAGPLSFAFQQHAMHPRLPHRGRSRSIFLATDSHDHRGSNSNAYRYVSDFLQNTSIQSIQDWFKNMVEPKALEHGQNLSLLNSLTTFYGVGSTTLAEQGDCPICFQSGSTTIMKVNANCGHRTCWKCEQDLNRAGNVACPLCRGIRFISTFENSADMFKATIGLLPRDYLHCSQASRTTVLSHSQCPSDPFGLEATESLAVVEQELSDRYLWGSNDTFLEYLHSITSASPSRSGPSLLLQYFQLNAAQDLCYRPSDERNFPEYSDHALIDPPTSGLILPPHRLYIALIHFCLDMITLPNPQEFQTRVRFKREYMVLELVLLFLVPTDQYSPRGSERIHNANAWIEHGQWILARIHRFLCSRARLSKMELEGLEQAEVGSAYVDDPSVPSAPIPRTILYLGAERWIWIAQSLIHLIGWIQIASENPLMMEPFESGRLRQSPTGSTVTKRAFNAQNQYQNPRPTKRARRFR